MPLAATHILIAIILVELFREYVVKNNKKFPRYYILVAAIGAILPDLDVAIFYGLSFFGFTIEQIHRTFLHTIFIPLILLIVGFGIYELKIKNSQIGKKHMKLHTIFYILAATSFLHLILDAIFTGQIQPFYPFTTYAIGFNLIHFFPQAWQSTIIPVLDAVLILFWIIWMEFKLKIDDYF